MKTSTYGEGSTFATNAGANNENVDYDKNGNITSLTRYRKGTGLIDNLTYTYKSSGASNMLDRVDDAVTGTNGFSELVKQANEYAYDGNGNLTSDANKGYNSIQYNYLNLPKRVGTTSQYISYIYDATGTKLAKVGTGGAYTYYAGSFVYNGSSLNYIINREGMYLPGGNYQYYLKDHLGNTRLVVNTSGTGGTVVQQTDYYPFGMDIATYNGGVDNKYRYNGKEFQDDMINGKSLQWYDYGARFYDPMIGRWHSVDPLAEKKPWISPNVYCSDNPMNRIDPDGMDDFFKRDGTFDHHTNTKVNHIMIINGKKSQSLTSFNYSSKNSANRSMLSNVGTFYANKAGINQQVGVIDVNTSSVGVAFASTNRSSLNVSINTDQKTGMISKEAGIADNVVNSFIHEKNHLDSPSLMGTPQGEINAIQSQVLDPSFTNTTSTYKGAIVSYAAQKLTLEISQGIKLGNVQRNILNLNNMLFGIGRFTYDATSQSVLFNLGVEEITVTAPKIK